MSVFESTAVLEDPRHLTLGRPVPVPGGAVLSRECRVIVMFEPETEAAPAMAWPPGFLDEIRVEDAAFDRPAQGTAPFIVPLDA